MRKINNQARTLSILGKDNVEKIALYAERVNEENVDYIESLAAKEYFASYHVGLNRRVDEIVGRNCHIML